MPAGDPVGGWDEFIQRLNQPSQNPAMQFGQGFAQGASPVPLQSSAASLHQIAQLLGLVFGLPSAYDALGGQMGQVGEALSHPGQTLGAIGKGVQQNPAGSAGFALGAMMPLGWHKFDPKLGALNEAGDIVRTTDMIRHWNPKNLAAEKGANELLQQVLDKRISGHLQNAEIPQWKAAQQAMNAAQIEHLLNTQVDKNLPFGATVRIPATPFTPEMHYVKQPKGWERLKALPDIK